MTGTVHDGRPYVGNPHVRFDEGDVALAATPRRGSLLYNRRNFLKTGAAGALTMASGAAFAGAVPGTDLMTQYSDVIIDAMRDIVKDERANLLKAADLLSDNANAGKLLHVYGAGGHSAIAAMEIFWRAGGLACA